MPSEGENGPTGREWGDLTRHVEEIRHRQKNAQTVQLGILDEIKTLEKDLRDVESRMLTGQARVWTAISVAAVALGLAGWVIELVVD